MSIGVVVGPLMIFANSVYNPNALEQSGLTWFFLAIAMLPLMGIGIGLLMFRRESHAAKDISISPKWC